MARGLREIRRKIKGFKSTRQVTKAMELVAASKMRRAVQNAVTLREYATLSWDLLERVALRMDPSEFANHPALQERPVKSVLGILITSDRGLCGSLNTQLFRAVSEYLVQTKKLTGFEKMDFIAVGRKGQQFLTRNKQTVIAAFPALSNHPVFRDILPIRKMAADAFRAGAYDHVVLFYPDFISALRQEPSLKVLLPFSPSSLKEMISSIVESKKTHASAHKKEALPTVEYKFEPSPGEVLSAIIPQLTEVQVYQAVLEACASEHSARMVAMRNATDSASDIIDDLTLSLNQTRQAGITAELSELSAAAAAMG